MTTERKQPTVDELRELLNDCRNVSARPRLPGKRTAWNERVLALREAFDLRHQWFAQDQELRLEIFRYLNGAGA